MEEGQEEEEEVVVPRRPRGGKAKRKPPLSTRRSGRVAGLDDHALGAASDDEDYCPPGAIFYFHASHFMRFRPIRVMSWPGWI